MASPRDISVVLACCAFLLSGCVTDSGQSSGNFFGPKLSSLLDNTPFRQKAEVLPGDPERPKLDIVIPIFDPGLPENESDYADKGIWPELRRAEAIRFAYKMKTALEETGAFGAVRVTPDKTATGDLYVIGKIEESDGEDVEMHLDVFDIAGKRWISKSFDHTVTPAFHRNVRNKGTDPYDPVFEEAAAYLVEELSYRKTRDLVNTRRLTDLRFGASFVKEAFAEHMVHKDGVFTLASFPSDADPMLVRTKAIRVRDQLFVDGMQDDYRSFSERMDTSYLVWQEQSLEELKAKRDAQVEAVGEAVAGVLLVGLAVAAVVAGADSQDYNTRVATGTAATIAGAAGGKLLISSFATSQEAKVHRDALEELGRSMDAEMAPRIVAYEEQNVELTGTATEQFAQWRDFLKKIYLQERTPEAKL